MNDELKQRIAKINSALEAAFLCDIPHHAPNHADPAVLLSRPCKTLLSSGGKRWRPLLMVLAYELAGGTDADIYTLAPLVEGIHTASLIHDDIEDNSELRRGKPCAHITYGLDTALNAGSWLYFQALTALDSYRAAGDIKLDLYAAAMKHIRHLHEGQALDIHWHKTPEFFPSQDNYLCMIRLKTGALAALAAYAGMRCAGSPHTQAKALSDLFREAGAGFQILDDVKNISTGNPGKKRGDDIVEGKKSLPLLIHIEKHPEDADALTGYCETARKEGLDSPAIEKAIAMLHESGAVAEARKQGEHMINTVLVTLDRLYGSTAIATFKHLFDLMQGK